MSHLLPLRGRPGAIFTLTAERELTRDDILRLATNPAPPRAPAPILQRLKASHHIAARMIAAGKSRSETARATGYTPQRIGDLQRDPSFQNLVTYYAGQMEEIDIQEEVEFQGTLKDVARTALEEIQSRLDDPAQVASMRVRELKELVEMGADRTIAPPKTAQPAVSVPATITFNIGSRDITPAANVSTSNATPAIEHQPGITDAILDEDND